MMTLGSSIKTSSVIATAFQSLWGAVKRHDYTHFWLKGGRGSTKSSFVSLCIVLLVIMFPFANAVVVRKVNATIRDSVYMQVTWAIETLGVTQYFRFRYSPMEITYLPTGQRIAFRGLDDPLKLKGIKFVKGYCAIVWFEEVDQFVGMEEIRSVLNSLRRGGDKFWIFYTYNPPKTSWSWVNKEALTMEAREDAIVHHSTYLDVALEHPDWIGEPFIQEAEILKQTNERAYRWELLGEITGTGGTVFENLTARRITDEEIKEFDNIKNGVDWGWFPDPWRWIRMHWDRRERRLYIFEEHSENKKTAKETGRIIRDRMTYADDRGGDRPYYHDEQFWCDSSNKSDIYVYRREYDIDAHPARKGGMRKESYLWLAGLREIVIDPIRCPLTFEEFSLCEYKKDSDQNWIEDFNDGNDHSIDAVRYAMMEEAIRRQ